MIYLDAGATTLEKPACVREAMARAVQTMTSPGRGGHSAVRLAEQTAFRCRSEAAALFGAARPEQVIFTQNATHGLNIAIRTLVRPGSRVAISGYEHNAVTRVLHSIPDVAVTVVDAPLFDPDAMAEGFAQALAQGADAAVCNHVSNVFGAVAPVAEIAALCRARGVLFHTDAVQAAGHLPIDLAAQPIDLLSLSAHKFHGPKGVGLLYARRGVQLTPLIDGGAQERGLRAGTENVPGIAAMAAAFEESCTHMTESACRVSALRDRLTAGLSQIPGALLNGSAAHRLPGIMNFCFEGVDGETLLLLLDQAGICVSTGSACAAGSVDPSHVLLALGRTRAQAHSSIRLSLSDETTDAEVDYLLETVPACIARLRG